jgi:glucose-6-phosphate 1-dehydrogenase
MNIKINISKEDWAKVKIMAIQQGKRLEDLVAEIILKVVRENT